VAGILLAFLPAAIIGGIFSKYIKFYLFNPWIVCATLVAGGLVLLVLDDTDLEVKKRDVFDFTLPMDLKIGLFQCLAMIPGVSRSGATIVGAMLMGADKRSATEFSFYLAIPTMAGAFAKDLLDNYKNLSRDDTGLIVIGFIVAFISAFIVVRTVLDYVASHGFRLFAWWRIIVGSLGFAGLIIFG
jgi:undecaprenyl-diphosphatase